ncbi:MAG: rod shape-determining protein MreC [bacterium]|nr:rod shape-determining protein MreC [bacterium]
MSYWWVKYKESIILIFLVALCLVLIGSSFNRQVQSVRAFFYYLLNPSQKISFEMLQDNSRLAKNILSLVNLREENLDLQEENYRLKSQIQQSREALAENERLKALLAYKKESPYYGQLAKVIGSEPENCYTSIWVNKGAEDSITGNMVVLAYQHGLIGLAGRVVEVQPRSSRVLLITDQESEVRVVNERTRYESVAKGENSFSLRLRYFLNEADIKSGDILVTSGKGGVFPPGLKVGILTEAFQEEDKLFKGGKAVPEINPGLLEEVLILSTVRK